MAKKKNEKPSAEKLNDEKSTPGHIRIKPLKTSVLMVPIRGYRPLVVHNWSQKAIMEMLIKQLGIVVYGQREPKDPEEEYRNSLYIATDGSHGFPLTAIKSGMVKIMKTPILKSQLKQAVFVDSDCEEDREITFQYKQKGSEEIKTYTCRSKKPLFRVEGEPQMRQDMVRIGQGVSDIRFRAEFLEWRAEIVVTYTDEIDADSVANLMSRAGQIVGIGEGRPEKKTDMGWGRYEIDPTRKIRMFKNLGEVMDAAKA